MISLEKVVCTLPLDEGGLLECSLPGAGAIEWVTAVGTLVSSIVAVAVAIYSVLKERKSAQKLAKAEAELAFNRAATRVTEAFEVAASGGQELSRQTMYRVTNAIQSLELVDYSKEYSGDKLIFVLHLLNLEIIQKLYSWSTSRRMERNSQSCWDTFREKRERILNETELLVRSVLENIQIAPDEESKQSLISDFYEHAEWLSKSLATTEPKER